jgi:hypothetical protein
MSNPSVFISSSVEGLPIAEELGRLLHPIADCNVWASSVFNPGITAIESLTEAVGLADFGIIVLTTDDRTQSRGETFHSPRDNLLFELGFLAGAIGISRTIFVVVGEPPRLKLPSDLSGVLYLTVSTDTPSGMVHAAHAIEEAIHNIGHRKTEKPIDFYSCFISYSWDDRRFARRLYEDLQTVGVRCWLDEKDLKIGQSLKTQIDRGIQVHDKVLLVLSQASVGSKWVNAEINHALHLEQARKQTILFPVRLDNAIMSTDSPEMSLVKEKYILDFSDWEDDKAYQRAFSRLVRGLALSASVES